MKKKLLLRFPNSITPNEQKKSFDLRENFDFFDFMKRFCEMSGIVIRNFPFHEKYGDLFFLSQGISEKKEKIKAKDNRK